MLMSSGGWKKRDADIAEALEHARARRMCLAAHTKPGVRLLERRVEAGALVRVFPHLYEERCYWTGLLPPERCVRVIRGAALLHPGWVFCDVSAAVIYGLEVSQPSAGVVHVVTSPRAHSASSACVARHVIGSPGVCAVGGVRVVDLATCVSGCLGRLDLPQGLAVGDSYLRNANLGTRDLVSLVAGIDCRARREHALRSASVANPLAENGGESVARGTMIELGYQVPDLQVEVPNRLDEAHPFRVDFMWRDVGDGTSVIGELDGMDKYRDPDMLQGRDTLAALSMERMRESRLTLAGSKVMRFRFADVLDRRRFARLLDACGIPKA